MTSFTLFLKSQTHPDVCDCECFASDHHFEPFILTRVTLLLLEMSATIPEGLSELLEDFAVAVLREKPADLLPFAAHYFTSLLEQRGGLLAAKQQQDTNWTPKIITTDEEKDVEMMNEGSHIIINILCILPVYVCPPHILLYWYLSRF